MKGLSIICGVILLLTATTMVWAGDCYCGDDCADGSCSYVEIGYVSSEVNGSEESNDERVAYPVDWLTSGRVYLPMEHFSQNRFEVRWDDLASNGGRAWARTTFSPLTLEVDGAMWDSYAWQMYGTELDLTAQEYKYYNAQLRFNSGMFDDMVLKYETREFTRDGTDAAPLQGFNYKRLTAQYNFQMGCDVRGQYRHILSCTEAPRYDYGTNAGMLTSLLKLEADLADDVQLYGRGSYSIYSYDYLPDDEMTAMDYTVGMRYRPDCVWTFDANYQTKEYPTDSTLSSHVDGLTAYGASATWAPGCGTRVEAGYKHRMLDYSRLQLQDSTLRSLLRGSTQLTQADVSQYYSLSEPEQDEVYLNSRYMLTDDLTLVNKITFTDGDAPGTDLGAANSASLYSDKRISNYARLDWNVNCNDQLAFTSNTVESCHGSRDGGFDMAFYEGSWSRYLGGCRYLTMALSHTDAELDTTGVVDAYTSDDWSYGIVFSDELPAFSYTLDYTYTDGSGADEYSQTAIGADLTLKRICCGPVGLRIDYFDRDFASNPLFATDALEFAVTYKIDLN